MAEVGSGSHFITEGRSRPSFLLSLEQLSPNLPTTARLYDVSPMLGLLSLTSRRVRTTVPVTLHQPGWKMLLIPSILRINTLRKLRIWGMGGSAC